MDTRRGDTISLGGSEEDKVPLRRSVRWQKRQPHITVSVGMDRDVFERWRTLGTEEGLETDTDIASFLVRKYESSHRGLLSSRRCVNCRAPLPLVCAACQKSVRHGYRTASLRCFMPPTPLASESVSVPDAASPQTSVTGSTPNFSSLVHAVTGTVHSTGDLMHKGPEHEVILKQEEENSANFGSQELPTNDCGSLSLTGFQSKEQAAVQSFAGTEIPTTSSCGSGNRSLYVFPALDEDYGEDDGDHYDNLVDPFEGSSDTVVEASEQTLDATIHSPDETSSHIFSEEKSKDGAFNADSIDSKISDGYIESCNGTLDQRKKTPARELCQKSLTCSLCEKAFRTTSKLKHHMKTCNAVADKDLAGQKGKKISVTKVDLKLHTCPLCEKTFRTAGGLKNHQKMHAKEGPYKCHVCSLLFDQSSDLKSHLETHSQEKQRKCQVCEKHFRTAAGLKRHMEKHKHESAFSPSTASKPTTSEFDNPLAHTATGTVNNTGGHMHKGVKSTGGSTHKQKKEKHYPCPYCDQTFKRVKTLTNHTSTHAEEVVIKCDYCNKVFHNAQTLKTHLLRAHSKRGRNQFRCAQCQTSFTNRTHLSTHLRTHSGDKPFMCDFCGAAFSVHSTLAMHRRTHTGEKPYECDRCEEKFTWKKSLDYHMFQHTKSFASLCHLCGAWFRTPDHLSDHLRRHETSREFNCRTCGKGFKTKSDLYSHTQYIHTNNKAFQCPHCDLAFVTKSMLKKHSRKHTGERPYQCQKCSKTFAYFSSLSAHRRLHEGKKQFTCEVCGVAFMMQWGLKLHMRKHTGEKPHRCQLCGQAFAWHSGLKNHMRKHAS